VRSAKYAIPWGVREAPAGAYAGGRTAIEKKDWCPAFREPQVFLELSGEAEGDHDSAAKPYGCGLRIGLAVFAGVHAGHVAQRRPDVNHKLPVSRESSGAAALFRQGGGVD
jgi:hypothetical protein